MPMRIFSDRARAIFFLACPLLPTCIPFAPIVPGAGKKPFIAPSIKSSVTWMEIAMNFFKDINKKDSAARLARQGMVNADSVSINQILDCIFLLKNATGEAWNRTNREAVAGMVLVVLAKNAELRSYLNATGWKLVLSFVKSNPDMARSISPRARGEILSYQVATREPMLAGFA